jgi:putative transport protein
MLASLATLSSALLTDTGTLSWWDNLVSIAAHLVTGTSVAGVVAVLCLVAATGIALGSIRIKGVSLGIAGVLFTGILYAHVCWNDAFTERMVAPVTAAAPAATAPANATQPAATNTAAQADVSHPTVTAPNPKLEEAKRTRRALVEFLRDFGLILFVYSVGIQVGPGFFSSLRAAGLTWNMLAVGVVAMGWFCAWAVYAFGHVSAPAAVGILSGAVTNVPGLAAAQQALHDIPGLGAADYILPDIGCATAYPMGVLGNILVMVLLRGLFRADPLIEAQRLVEDSSNRKPGPGNVNLTVTNPGVLGKTIASVLESVHLTGDVVISRLAHEGEVRIATPDMMLQAGDIIHAVGVPTALERLQMIVGERCPNDLRNMAKKLNTRRLLVTNHDVVGKAPDELGFSQDYGVAITRVTRAGVEFVAGPNVDLHYGDTLVAVGATDGLNAVEKKVGNSVKQLEHPHLIPVFVGIVVGVVLGLIPISVPGLPAPVKLGLAGGPMIAALVFSRLGHVGRISFFLPHSANMMIRELGIVMFLSCVGLISGEHYVDTILHGDGLTWMLYGALITMIPLLIMGLYARYALKINFLHICGIMAGSQTNPPALSFANTVAGNDAPAVAMATVYPLTMTLRILTAQLFVIFFASR